MRTRETELIVSLTGIKKNLGCVKNLINGRGVCAVVKANAYGLGALEVSRALCDEGVDWLAVATIDEGVFLREAGITAPEILVLGGDYGNVQDILHHYNLVPSLYSKESFELFFREKKSPQKFQIELDTGMSRLGLSMPDLDYVCSIYQDELRSNLIGVFTHFSHADEQNLQVNEQQVTQFECALSKLVSSGIDTGIVHAANGAAVIAYPKSHYQMVRPGLMLYGINPLGPDYDVPLEMVVTWRTKPLMIRKICKGQTVSYGGAWTAPKDSKIAVLPVGYADGYSRLLSNKAKVLVRGKPLSVIGKVCMDYLCVDVSEFPDIDTNEDVVLLGEQKGNVITVHQMAEWANTIPYEILCSISNRVTRTYIS